MNNDTPFKPILEGLGFSQVPGDDAVVKIPPKDLPYYELSSAIESIADLIERISVMKPLDTYTIDRLKAQLNILLRMQSEYFTLFRIISY